MQQLPICIGPIIRIGRESWCLPYAGFFSYVWYWQDGLFDLGRLIGSVYREQHSAVDVWYWQDGLSDFDGQVGQFTGSNIPQWTLRLSSIHPSTGRGGHCTWTGFEELFKGLILGRLRVDDAGLGLEQDLATAYCFNQFQSSRYLDCQGSHITCESIYAGIYTWILATCILVPALHLPNQLSLTHQSYSAPVLPAPALHRPLPGLDCTALASDANFGILLPHLALWTWDEDKCR